ncbi:MAG: c-type cytochrome [Bacteroidia bacterium]|nr:c-type cytochrome [Sphingobacteriaceae bacterium]MBK7310186.1 c-type cytochrome [Sphingobacteriaceae bacterium]MBP9082327.1 c-type cytochrome [Bacteroidia bacterium]
MECKSIKNVIRVFALVVCTSQLPLIAQNGEATFKQTCGACHTIGKGKVVGPDLMNVHKKRKEEWIIKFVKGSQAFIKSGDADAKAIFDEFNGMVMPDQPLKDEDIKAVIAYIGAQSDGAAVSEPVADASAKKETPSTVTPDQILKGRAYFEGSMAFSKGGASCISCHNVNYDGVIAGGVLAKDLTDSYTRLGGEAGLNGMLSSPPFPAMTAAFKNNPLTSEEIAAISAFLKDAGEKKSEVAGWNPLLLGGFAGFIVLFGIIMVMWNKRKNNSTKKEYHERQIKAIN